MTEFISPSPRRRQMSRPGARRRAAGFTLIEILVALLVLAIGLLGVAAMQLRGLNYSHDAYLRSQISVLAYDMSDRMRLNRTAAASYVGEWDVPTTEPTCSTAMMATVSATNDLACWRRQVYDAMPPGAEADIIAETGGEYTIALKWIDRLADPSDPPRNVEYTFQP